jgi:hypothetical protein
VTDEGGPTGAPDRSWRDDAAVWRIEVGPDQVVVHAALALVYCPVAMSHDSYRLLREADQVEAVVGRLLRSERDRQGVVPLGGFFADEREVAALLRQEAKG